MANNGGNIRPRVGQSPQELLDYITSVIQQNGGPDQEVSERRFGAAGWRRFSRRIRDILGANFIAYPVAWDSNLRDTSFNRFRKDLVHRVKNDLRGRTQESPR